ncbi:MAG: tetratricopeptide repeat protein [Sphingomonas fennica]
MSGRSFPARRAALLIGAAAVSASVVLPAAPAVAAEAAAVAALFRQANFWREKERPDLALAAVRRILAVEPNNARAKALAAELTKAPPVNPTQPATAGIAPGGQRLGDRALQQRDPNAIYTTAVDPDGRRIVAPAPPPRQAPRPYVRSATDTAGEYRLQGFRLIDQGRFAEAESRFQAALRINSNDRDATGGLGIARLRRGRFDEARTLLQRAGRGSGGAKWNQALQSATFYGQLRVAQAARDGNRLDEATRLAGALKPADARQNALARTLMASILEGQGRYPEALAMYRSIPGGGGAAGAQAVAEAQTRAARIAAMQAAARGDYPAAERVFQQALLGGSADPWLRYEYARLLVATGRTPQADEMIAPLATQSGAEARYAAALYASQLGRVGDANRLIAQIPAGERTPQMAAFAIEQNVAAGVLQARALDHAGRRAEAIGLLRQMAAQPLPIPAAGAVADALYAMGDTGTGVALAQSAAAQPIGGEPDAYQGIVVVLAKAGYDAVAVPLVDRITQSAGQSPYNARAIGRLHALLAASRADRLRLQGAFAPAFDILQAAYPAAPGDVDLLASLARLYQSGQFYGPALEVYGMVRQQRPDDVGNLLGFADSAIGANRLDEAQEAASTALRIAPNDPQAYQVAARVEQARGRDGAALKLLRQARTLRAQQTGAYGPALSPTNPFAASTARPAMQGPVNPFLLVPRGAPAAVRPGPAIGLPYSFLSPVPATIPGAPATVLEG